MRTSEKRFARRFVQNETGMTLIEIMIVIAIIAGLMAVLGTGANSMLQKSRVENAKIQMKELSNKLEAYNLSCNSYPTGEHGLEALIENPGDDVCSNWGPEPYLQRKSLKDPWGREFMYDSDGGSFVLRSFGRDRKEGGDGYDKDLTYPEE